MDSLLEQIPEDNGATAVITVKTENIPTSPTQKPRQNTPIYDPAIIYILEFCTVLALRSQDTVELLGKRVGNALHAILRDASRYHPILVERTAFYLFHLLQASYDFDYIRVPIVLHTVSSFSKELLINTSALVLRGLKLCIEKPSPLRNEIMTSPDFWVILRVLATHPDSSAVVFEILESGITGKPSAIMADNYEEVLSLLNDFATMAHVGSVAEQKADKKSGRKGRPAKQEKPRYVPLFLTVSTAANPNQRKRRRHQRHQSHPPHLPADVADPPPHEAIAPGKQRR